MTEFKPLSIDNKTRLKLGKPLDPALIKQKPSGNSTVDYIAGSTCVDMLNEIFGHMWSFEITNEWIQEGFDQIQRENRKYPFKPDDPFVEVDAAGKFKRIPQGPTAWCEVKLTVYVQGPNGDVFPITKMACGSQAITGNQSLQANTGFKGAQTDGMKKAASLLGIAQELYRDDEEKALFVNKYDEMMPVVWTEDVIKKHETEWNTVLKVTEDYGWNIKDDLGYYVYQVTNGYTSDLYKMPEDCLTDLLNTITSDDE
jgi:hypothetical protein